MVFSHGKYSPVKICTQTLVEHFRGKSYGMVTGRKIYTNILNWRQWLTKLPTRFDVWFETKLWSNS